MKIDPEKIQRDFDPIWYNNLRGMLGMLDQIIRFYGDREEVLKEMAGNFIWELTKFNLPYDTEARHEDEFERCGTFPKFKGEPGISHLIAEYMPRHHPGEAYWRAERESSESE